MRILVTGGLGFIGSAVVRMLINDGEHEVLNLDKMTYAASPESVASVSSSARYRFVRADIADGPVMQRVFAEYLPDAVIHLAAESHVDRSIDSPGAFIVTNVVGTYELLEAARHYWLSLHAEKALRFRFLHVSTDEVFGSLGRDDSPFNESTPYSPRSPYSASKAGSDHLVRAWHETYGLPVVITNCSTTTAPIIFPRS